MKKLLIIPLLLIIGSLIILWLVINPLRRELPILRHAINVNRGQLEAYARIMNQKDKVSEVSQKNQNYWEVVKQTALPRGQELDLITMLESLAEKQGVIQRLRLDESKPMANNDWRQSELFLELESSFVNIAKYLQQLEGLPYLLTLKTIRLNQAGDNNVHVILGGQILWQ